MPRSPLRAVSVAAVLATASIGLAGCLDTGFPTTPTSSGSTRPSGTASGTPSPSGSPTPSATPTIDPPTALSLDCDALIPLQPLYDLNPNYSLVPAASAASGSLAAAVLAERGTACQIVHNSSGATAVVAISQPSPAGLAADKAAAGASGGTATDPSTGKGYPVYGSDGELQAFTATHRYTAEAGASFDPDDLRALLAIALSAQG